jgi:hypothetical protein
MRYTQEKHGVEVKIEEQGERSSQRKRFLKFSIVSRNEPGAELSALNPTVPSPNGMRPSRCEFTRWFYGMLVDTQFEASSMQLIWSLHKRSEFFRCFPFLMSAREIESAPIVNLLTSVRTASLVKIGWDLSYGSYSWNVKVGPKLTWEDTKQTLIKEIARPSTEAEFGLGSSAAALFDWIRRLEPAELESGLTPQIETAIRDQTLMLDCPWKSENLKLFLELLCEEISDRTPLDLRVVDWKQSGSTSSRIRVKTMKTKSA